MRTGCGKSKGVGTDDRKQGNVGDVFWGAVRGWGWMLGSKMGKGGGC